MTWEAWTIGAIAAGAVAYLYAVAAPALAVQASAWVLGWDLARELRRTPTKREVDAGLRYYRDAMGRSRDLVIELWSADPTTRIVLTTAGCSCVRCRIAARIGPLVAMAAWPWFRWRSRPARVRARAFAVGAVARLSSPIGPGAS